MKQPSTRRVSHLPDQCPNIEDSRRLFYNVPNEQSVRDLEILPLREEGKEGPFNDCIAVPIAHYLTSNDGEELIETLVSRAIGKRNFPRVQVGQRPYLYEFQRGWKDNMAFEHFFVDETRLVWTVLHIPVIVIN